MTTEEIISKAISEQKQNKSIICPRCGLPKMKAKLFSNALSRRADIYVCDSCGMEEALCDFCKKQDTVDTWYIISCYKAKRDD